MKIKNYTLLALFITVGLTVNAQKKELKVGNNPTIKESSAVFEVESSNKGLLAPRVSLTGLTDVTTIDNAANALTVFNTATDGVAPNNVSPGYYYWSVAETKWIRLATQFDMTEPWNIQNTADDATLNTQDIYQQGRVAIGFDENDAVSTRQLEVKGDFKTEIENNGLYNGFVSNENVPLLGANGNTLFSLKGGDFNDYLAANPLVTSGSFFSTSESYVLGATFNDLVNSSLLISAVNDQYGFGLIGQQLTGQGQTVVTGNNDELFLRLDPGFSNDDYTSSIHMTNGALEKNITLKHRGDGTESAVIIDPLNGVEFGYKETGITSTHFNYRFPRTTGVANQVLTTDGAAGGTVGQLSWENVGDLVKSAMPKFFYMPAVIFNTSANGTFTKNLHAEYQAQFTGTGNPTLVSSSGATNAIPTLPANELEYHITYYDTAVFANLSIDANGVLTYDIIGNPTEASYMTIVFVVK